ncbi:MAG: NUDIX hydrolase [Chloroflexota bacterium]
MKRFANFCPNCGTALVLRDRHGRERPVCEACGHIVYFDPKVAVIAVVIQDERVLLVQRAMNPGMGKWACPAGFVEYDEAPTDAVLRELKEETNLDGKIEGLIEVFPKKDDGLADIVIAYRVSIIGGNLEAGDDADNADWFTRDSLPELVFYPSITLIGERWRSGGL